MGILSLQTSSLPLGSQPLLPTGLTCPQSPWAPASPQDIAHHWSQVPKHDVLPTLIGPIGSLSWGFRAGRWGMATCQGLCPHIADITGPHEIRVTVAMVQMKPLKHRNPLLKPLAQADGSQSATPGALLFQQAWIPELGGRCWWNHRLPKQGMFLGTWSALDTHPHPHWEGPGLHLQFQPAGRLRACPIDEGPPEPLLTVRSIARRPPVDEVPQVLQTEDRPRGPAPASLTWTSTPDPPPTLRTCCSRHSAHTPLLSAACCRPQDHIHLPQVSNMATISWPPASPHTDPLHLP